MRKTPREKKKTPNKKRNLKIGGVGVSNENNFITQLFAFLDLCPRYQQKDQSLQLLL